MLNLRRCVVGVVAVLLMSGVTGAQTQTPTSLETDSFVIHPQFDFAWPFSEGLAAVRIGDFWTGKHGFIDKTGSVVINPQFAFAFSFSDGLASVEDGTTRKYGFIAR